MHCSSKFFIPCFKLWWFGITLPALITFFAAEWKPIKGCNTCFAQHRVRYEIFTVKISVVIFCITTLYSLVGEYQSSVLWRQRQYVPLKWWNHPTGLEHEYYGEKTHYSVPGSWKRWGYFLYVAKSIPESVDHCSHCFICRSADTLCNLTRFSVSVCTQVGTVGGPKHPPTTKWKTGRPTVFPVTEF